MIKVQVIIEKATGKIIAIFFSKGKTHDFQMFKNSSVHIVEHIKLVGDSGYQGIQKNHANSETPKKKPRKGTLSDEEKRENQRISKYRISIEHINRRIKCFRIFSGRYRNRRKRFGLRMSLLCGIHNFELSFCA
jgi:hypothetical protein